MLRRLALVLTLATTPPAWAQAVPATSGLLDVYRQALEQDASLAAAQADYLARREAVPQARAALLPSLSAGASLSDTRSTLDSPALTRSRSGLLYQASLSQPLFRADRWFGLQAAEALGEQAALEFSAARQALILDSAEAYFAVLRSRDALAAARAEEAAYQRQLDEARERFEIGLAERTGLLEARAAFDNARASRIGAEQRLEDARQALATLTQREHPALPGLRHDLPALPPQPNDAQAWVEGALRQNLELQASRFAVEAAGQRVRQRRADHAPSLDAVAGYQRGDNDSLGFVNGNSGQPRYAGTAEQHSLSLQLNIPLYSGGLTGSQVREASQRLIQGQQQHEALQRRIVEDTRRLHRAVNAAIARIEARRQAIRSSRSALEATEAGYRLGTRNAIDVLNAQRQLYASVRDYNEARYDHLLDTLRLQRAAGTLSPADLHALDGFLLAGYREERDFLPEAIPVAREATSPQPVERRSERLQP